MPRRPPESSSRCGRGELSLETSPDTAPPLPPGVGRDLAAIAGTVRYRIRLSGGRGTVEVTLPQWAESAEPRIEPHLWALFDTLEASAPPAVRPDGPPAQNVGRILSIVS